MLRSLKNETRHVALIGLTLGHIKKLKSLLKEDIFTEKYLIFYGVSISRVIWKIPIFYIDPPLIRGYAMKRSVSLVHEPVLVFVNADSKCIEKSLVKNAIEDIELGKYKMFLSIPFTSSNFEKSYNRVVAPILKDVLGINNVNFPSYSLVIGLRKYFDLDEYTLWSYEHLALLNTLFIDKSSVRIEHSECVDTIPELFNGVEDIFIKSLAKSIVNLAIRQRIIEEKLGKKLIEGLL
ncbi:hypothetical protein QPL79_07350 [Ignisphaera sp. 4213-co]|uniref:DUF115 domain-containing protein n=1 Tax=Ignisphaera cupida TaxID=3050454 RepID=A0ABD4Z765_9CREN|nr:hypothetical protein [Ignisphaera sp. 4213-co]MDK6029176.1 hypothetical protein [Ignisphaera sp. 4213-co]